MVILKGYPHLEVNMWKEETAKKIEGLKTQLNIEKSSHLLQVNEITEKERKISEAKKEQESLQKKLAKTEKSLMIWKAELETSESDSKATEERARELSVSKDLLMSEVEAKEKMKEEVEEAHRSQMKSIEERRVEEKSLRKEKKSSLAQLEKLTKDVRRSCKMAEARQDMLHT